MKVYVIRGFIDGDEVSSMESINVPDEFTLISIEEYEEYDEGCVVYKTSYGVRENQ